MDTEEVAKDILKYFDNYAFTISNKIGEYNSYKLLKEIEVKFPVDEIYLSDGTKIWNLIRIFFSYELPKILVYKDKIAFKSKSKKITFNNIIHFLRESLQPLNSFEKNLIFSFSSSESRKKNNHYFYDIYFDPLYQLLDDELVVCEWPESSGFRRDYGDKVYSKKFIKMNIPLISSTFFEFILVNVFNHFTKIKVDYIHNLDIIYEILEYIEFKSKIKKSFIEHHLFLFISTFNILKKYFKNFLMENNPKAVLLRCAYGRFPMSLTQACKELDIPTIEVQHGLFTPHSPGYVKNRPSNNYDCVPDCFISYGDAFTEIVKNGHLFQKNQVYTGGFPYLDLKTKEKSKRGFMKNEGFNILFSSQWTLVNEIKDFIFQVGKLLDKNDDNFKLMFKPHPFSNNNYSIFNNIDSIQIIEKYEDFYSLVPLCHIHSTVYSTTGIESFSFEKPTIFIDVLNLGEKQESIFFVSKPNQFIENIKYIKENYDFISEKSKKIGKLFFREKPIENFDIIFKEIGIK